jgi:hypothetical protein
MVERRDVEFEVERGDRLRGWLFTPEAGTLSCPAISMAHGYAGEKEHGLERFALAIAGAGFDPVDIGHTDTDHTTSLYVRSIGLVIAGDAIYNGTHPYLVESDRQGLLHWLAAIDKIEALNPRAVVVGHGPIDPDNSPRHIQETRRYIQDFMRADDETQTARELYDRMLALYPDRINPGSLWGSANAAKASHLTNV